MPISAQDARRLMQDQTLSTIIEDMRQMQVDVFLTSRRSDVDKREEAHCMLRMLELFESHLRSPLRDEALAEKRKNHSKQDVQ